MSTPWKALTIALLAGLTVSAQAVDQVRLVGGGSKRGEVTGVSREGVTIETVDGATNVPIDEVRYVIFEDEPPLLTQTYSFIERGGYETALEKLNDIAGGAGLSDLVQEEIDFYRAFCVARLAIVGMGDAQDAGRQLAAFVREHGDSFHYYEAMETMGDLLASLGRFEQAERTYGQLAKSPSLALKARAALLAGRTLQSQGKHEDALRRFDALIGARSTRPGVAEAQQAARLAKAESLAATGDLEGGLNLAREVIQSAGENDTATLAKGYNTLGLCYEAAQQWKDALFAYLHTDLLFNSDPATHAEALGHLIDLWRKAGKPEASNDARTRLSRQYASSPQARSNNPNHF